jgi:small subunit ribosomal protein S2
MLEAGVHFGHKTSRWHPRMEPYIFGSRNGIHIIDLEKTSSVMKNVLEQVKDLVARGGTVLFVGTKRQAASLVKKHAEECGMPYVTKRWLGGTFTNFSEVSNLIRRYHQIKDDTASGAIAKKYTKKEQVRFGKELEELEGKVGGIQDMKRLPDAVFVVDAKAEKTCVDESKVRGIPVIGLLDTNVDPDDIKYGIPSNDDAVKTLEMMIALVAAAIKEGKANQVKPAAPAEKKVAAKAEEKTEAQAEENDEEVEA